MATSIESKLSLALAVKLKGIFEKEDRFLTFPLGIGFTYSYLTFMRNPAESGLSAVDQQNIKCDFARAVNCSFTDNPQYTPDANIFLWNRLQDVLRNTVFPKSTLTNEEENQLTQASQFLTVEKTDEAGNSIRVPSPAYNEYIKYKTIYDKANYFYLDEKSTVENTSGTEGDTLKLNWKNFREKQLLDEIKKAEQDWLNFGQKINVENYQALKNSLEQKKYAILYKEAYLNEIKLSETPDLNAGGLSTYLSFFSPFDVFDKSVPWISVNLTKTEINNLVLQAPAELKAIFNAGEGSDDIESVSLEYNNVVICRPWFKPEFFQSRYWNVSDASIVSDGNTPRNGLIPAYISSMIVARNITVTRRKSVTAQPLVLPILMKKAPIQSREAMSMRSAALVKRQTSESVRPIVSPKSQVKLSPTVAATRTSTVQLRAQPRILETAEVNKKPIATNTYSSLKYIGTTVPTPIYIPPPIATSFSLAELAGDPQSRWASGQLIDENNTAINANLPWMGGEGDSLGFVRADNNVLMEDGNSYSPVLRTHPKWIDRGTIKGWLAWRTLPANAHLQAKVGFLNGALGTDGVTFWVFVHYLSNGVEQWIPVIQHYKKYTQTLDSIDYDLSAYAGQSISIELRVDAGPSSGQDWAAWVNPIITSTAKGESKTELVTETYDFDGVFVLAYSCKRVPKAANPDPTLNWS